MGTISVARLIILLGNMPLYLRFQMSVSILTCRRNELCVSLIKDIWGED